MRTWLAFALVLLGLLAATAPPGLAQNLIVQNGWQGFALRTADGAFDRCVLYNRTIEALNADPYNMLGLSRDRAGNVGALVFFEPGALTRGRRQAVSLKLDQNPAMTMTGDAVSDFHVVIGGPFPPETLAALRQATSLEVTVEGRTIQFAVAGLGAVLDRLEDCVKTYAH